MLYSQAGKLIAEQKAFWGRLVNQANVPEHEGEIKLHCMTSNGMWVKIDFKGPISDIKTTWVLAERVEYICGIDRVPFFIRQQREKQLEHGPY